MKTVEKQPEVPTYPFDAAPKHGEAVEVAPGVRWMRKPLPPPLAHINTWAIDDGAGWAAIDTGVQSPETAAAPVKILFVCLANLCRSPLAVALTRHRHAPAIEAQSAGVAPAAARMFPEALQVIRRITGQDMSGHVPRFVLDARPEEYDYIIAMDSSVFLRLSQMPQIPQDKLYGWEIADPAGYGVDAYEKTAAQIEDCLEQFLLNREMERGLLARRS